MFYGAGCLFRAKSTGRYLFAKRHRSDNHASETWCTWGGGGEAGGTPRQTLDREVLEEAGFDISRLPVSWKPTFRDGKFSFYNAVVEVDEEFEPTLNDENEAYVWVDFGKWPTPLHRGVKTLVENLYR